MAQPKAKTPRESLFITRKIVGQGDLNPNGTLFGGMMVSWMDEVAYMSARKHAGREFCVTVNIDNIVFLYPLRLGEAVVLTSQVNYVGSSSMEIGVKVEKENPYTGELLRTNSAYLTFVALDKKGKPTRVPSLTLETDEDHRRFQEARLRLKVRARMKAAFKRKLFGIPPVAKPNADRHVDVATRLGLPDPIKRFLEVREQVKKFGETLMAKIS